MKALSIKQPWADSIVFGHKSIECRSWETNYRGELFIHASKVPDLSMKELKELYEDELPPLGSIVGKVDLIDCRKFKSPSDNEKAQLDKSVRFNGFAWILSNPLVLEVSIPMKGALRIYNIPSQIQELLKRDSDFFRYEGPAD